MAERIVLTQAELQALADLQAEREPSAAGIASIIERGLASRGDDGLVFSEAAQGAFEALATCEINVLVMDDSGEALDQYYIGAGEACARVTAEADGLAFERLAWDEVPEAIAAGLISHLTAAKPSTLPAPEAFATLAEVLEMPGLQPLSWGGLAVSRGDPEQAEADAAPEWTLIVRCEPGYVWQCEARSVTAFAHNEEELAYLIAETLADGSG
jgi:hypothetical protein